MPTENHAKQYAKCAEHLTSAKRELAAAWRCVNTNGLMFSVALERLIASVETLQSRFARKARD